MVTVETINEVAGSLTSIATFKSCLPINDGASEKSSHVVSAVSFESVSSSASSASEPVYPTAKMSPPKSTKAVVTFKPMKSYNSTFSEYFTQESLKVTRTDVNPFENNAHLSNMDLVQVILGTILLVPIRLFCLFWVGIATLVVGAIVTFGYSEEELNEKPFEGWRLRSRKILVYFAKFAVFLAGYNRVKFSGKRATSHEARVLALVPHTTFIDSLAVFLLELPCIVMAKTTFFTFLARPVQPITIDRRAEHNKAKSMETIKARCENERWPQILIFPEGTTTNGSALVSFKLGAFLPGAAIQPIVIKHKKKLDVPSWDKPFLSFIKLGIYMLSQFTNEIELTYLPVYEPSETEREDAKLYSKNFRKMMADHLKLKTTDHSFDDCRLMVESRKLGLPFKTGLIEFDKIKEKFKFMNYRYCYNLLVKYGKVVKHSNGLMSINEYCSYLNLKPTPIIAKLFNIYDRENVGFIHFRQFLIGQLIIMEYLNNKKNLRYLFNMLDRNGKGFVNFNDYQLVYHIQFMIPLKRVVELFREIDTNGDNFISYDEFEFYSLENLEMTALTIVYYEYYHQTEV